MWWMWIVGPILVLIIYVLTGARDKRSEAEIDRWRRSMGPKSVVRKEHAGYRDRKELTEPGPGAKLVTSLPGPLHRMVEAAGGGAPVARIELVPKLAYLAAMAANATSASDHQTVVTRLEEPAPSFTVRPLPIVEGARIANTGIEFKKDPEFTALFLVEAATHPAGSKASTAPSSADQAKKIRAFLSRPIRDALRELPDAWLRVAGKAMALTLYGPADADKLNQLVTAADAIFAEHGAGGGPSLFGDLDEEEDEADEDEAGEAPPSPPPVKKGTADKAAGKAARTKS
jgi:hypothetical protein